MGFESGLDRTYSLEEDVVVGQNSCASRVHVRVTRGHAGGHTVPAPGLIVPARQDAHNRWQGGADRTAQGCGAMG